MCVCSPKPNAFLTYSETLENYSESENPTISEISNGLFLLYFVTYLKKYDIQFHKNNIHIWTSFK